jgi:predicted Zn-dependent protease
MPDGRKFALALVLAAAAGSAGACSSPSLTESQEYYVGRGVTANAIARDPLYEADAELEKYVTHIGYTIALESDRPETFKGYHFGVLKSDSINAFAAPGGFILVTTGALKACQNEDELAGLIAHEVAHVVLRHPEIAANRASDKAGAFKFLSGAADIGIGLFAPSSQRGNLKQLVGAFTKVLDDLADEIVNGYGRDDELAADAMAVDLMSRPGVGYDPRALKDFIARLPKAERGAWSTHPELEGRVKIIEQEIEKRKARAGIDPARTNRFKSKVVGLKGS